MLKEFQHQSSLSFEDTIETLKELFMKKKYGTLCSISLSDKFKEKNIPFDSKLTILEICNPLEANKLITINTKAMFLLPCKVLVIEKNGKTTVELVLPTSFMSLFDDPALTKAAQEIETAIVNTILEV